ncbi:hypothetical protein Bca4012_012743 [Brassica carinata]
MGLRASDSLSMNRERSNHLNASPFSPRAFSVPDSPHAHPCDGQSANATDLRPLQWLPIPANRIHAGVPHLPLPPLRVDPPKPIAATAMAGARRSERDLTAGFSRRRVLPDPEEPPLLQGQLRDDRLPRPRPLSPLPSSLSPRPPLPLRRVDLPLPVPPVRSAALRPRTHVLGSRDARRFGYPDGRRRLLDQRRISADHCSDDRFRNRVFARRVQSPGGSFLG